MDHFIETVRKYPCLWNTTAIEYRDQELKDAAWAEVMKETDLSSDSYRDALKRHNEMLAKEPSSHTKKNYPWKYMEAMHFLQPYMSNRKKPVEALPAPRNGHGGTESSETESEPEGAAPAPPVKRRRRRSVERLGMIDRKLDYLCQQRAKRPSGAAAAPDPLDIFFNSMCQSTKRFPFQTQIGIKRRLFEAVMEAEEVLLAEQQSYASLWAADGARASSSASSEPDLKPS
ncbi:putative Transcription factor Adf-1 [Operophtera brumata]|uniref:Putative Transcription factor Adf-1 n=1 Tax=Operophtera brumata TaxID=104452 RepID=A0A0L7KZ31_OPEBR|nr:putative Transcription factor Adf-1 [Operophtera brumata]